MLVVKLWVKKQGQWVHKHPSHPMRVRFMWDGDLDEQKSVGVPDSLPNLLDLGSAFISGFRSRAQGCAVN